MDSLYDYQKFEEERLKGIFYGWDEFRGNHGAVMRKCAEIHKGKTVLDVGCGLCHLYELIKEDVEEYVGVDIDQRLIEWARERYPQLRLEVGSVYDLSFLTEEYDTVYAIGLYRKINEINGIREMLKHTKQTLVLTYLHKRDVEPPYFPEPLWGLLRGDEVSSIELISTNITGIEIIRLNK